MVIIVVHKYPLNVSVSLLGYSVLIPFVSAAFIIPSHILCENLKGKDYVWSKRKTFISLTLAFLVPAIFLYFNVGEVISVASCGLVQCYSPTRVGVKLAEFINIYLVMQATAGPSGNSGVGGDTVAGRNSGVGGYAVGGGSAEAAAAPASIDTIEYHPIYVEANEFISEAKISGLGAEEQSDFVLKGMKEKIVHLAESDLGWDLSNQEIVKIAMQDAGICFSDIGSDSHSESEYLQRSDSEEGYEVSDYEKSEPKQSVWSESKKSENVGCKRSRSDENLNSRFSSKKIKKNK